MEIRKLERQDERSVAARVRARARAACTDRKGDGWCGGTGGRAFHWDAHGFDHAAIAKAEEELRGAVTRLRNLEGEKGRAAALSIQRAESAFGHGGEKPHRVARLGATDVPCGRSSGQR